MSFTVSHTDGATGLRGAAAAFVGTVAALDEPALLEPSRCRGWSRLEVVDHVLAGWRELFAGLGRQLDHVAAGLPEGFHAFQGHVLTSGDLMATWAVETVLHQLDLDTATDVPAGALRLARRTAEHVDDFHDRLPPAA
jgi:hypothetical protein